MREGEGQRSRGGGSLQRREGECEAAGPSQHVGGSRRPCSLAVCAFPYLLAFTTDSIEIRLVVNGNLVHTAVVPQLQLLASRVSRPGLVLLSEGLWEPPAPGGVRQQGHPPTQLGGCGRRPLCVRMRKGDEHAEDRLPAGFACAAPRASERPSLVTRTVVRCWWQLGSTRLKRWCSDHCPMKDTPSPENRSLQ